MSFRNPSFSSSPPKVQTLWTRHTAQRKLQKSVASGKVKKPARCQRCKMKIPKHKLQGHHRNYQKPLDVQWYCQACHYAMHGPRFQARAFYRQMQRESRIIGH